MTVNSILLILWTVIHILLFFMVTLHCLQRRSHASSTLLWIFLAWTFPGIGPLIYLCFGIDRVADRGFLKFLTDKQLYTIRQSTKEIAPRAYWNWAKQVPVNTEFNWALDSLVPDQPAHTSNLIRPLVNGDEVYPEMIQAIRSATDHIHLQSFIIANDVIGRKIMDELANRAADGVTVRVLYDRFGSTRAHLSGFFRSYKQIKNFHIAGWTQANPLKRQFQINLRNHRKLLVIDGKSAFFGGINIQDKNTSSHPDGAILDYHFYCEGLIVQELQYSFLRDWYFITGEHADFLLTEEYFPLPRKSGEIAARLINTGPSTRGDIAIETYFNSITLAKHEILAVTPYFIPPVEILRALRSAARRGVEVRLIVPKRNNHLYAGFASRAHYEDLLLAGVKIYERHPPFMHAKALIIDDQLSLVGTANLDHRSLNLNYESTIAIFGKIFADQMRKIIHDDLEKSDEVLLSDWEKRPASHRQLENLAVLLAPVI